MERIENIGFGGLQLIQERNAFCYGVDAVILADFTYSICPEFRTCIDLGTGTGIIPFILSHKNRSASFKGIELQDVFVDMSNRSCRLNGLENRIQFLKGDVSCPDEAVFPKKSADVVTCNPPYFPRGGGIPSENQEKWIARHETSATVEDFIRTAAGLLDRGGHFFMVHRPSRLVDLFYYCRKYKLEPKDIRYVAPREGEIPNILLLHCIAGGGKELKYMRDLYIYNKEGGYTEEIERIYERKPLD